ncbi:GIY-YIG nuclease family protein [Neobacillus sp.]|uniref:GIY-YIG nuclease family protein n=1 Tax=Neobacillus sp. TaxID=2675273 RepID=UPI0037C7AC2A
MNLKDKVKNLPSSAGVYLMKDSSARIIYVGKAKNLKNRVRSYFQNSNAHSEKIKKLKANIKDFELILTDTEFEAFLLECKLIQEIKPLFNKKMKNPQSYTYILIHKDDNNRRLEMTNSPEKDGYLSFGPFTSKHTVEKAIQGIKEFYKINCSSPCNKNTPCLNYSLGLCIGRCTGSPNAVTEYNTIMNKIIALLTGTNTNILVEMKQTMALAAENFDFETAAKHRDFLDAINFLIKKEQIIGFTEANKNIAVLEPLTGHSIKLFLIKGNQVLFSKKYELAGSNLKQLVEMIKLNTVTYFTNEAHPTSFEISKDDIDEAQIIYSYLKSSNCCYKIIPEKWIKTVNNPKLAEALSDILVKMIAKSKVTAANKTTPIV